MNFDWNFTKEYGWSGMIRFQVFYIFTNSKNNSYNRQYSNGKEEVKIHCSHGGLGQGKEWKQPKLMLRVTRFQDLGTVGLKPISLKIENETLKEKIALLAQLINNSKNCVIYTGAGISRASGIADYATKAKKSIAGSENLSLNRLQAEPSTAHYIIAQMQRKGKVQQWIQQNHDGLAQKAGFPMSKLNQIHGSWFDKKNTVVMMDDCLNPKNYKQMEQWQEKVDLCLAIGTSLCGMRSDGIAKRAAKQGRLVVINLQQTPYDEQCDLRLYGNLQTVIEMLGKQLGIKITKKVCLHSPYE